jgi:AraC-like DNA-binding protein
MEAPRRVELVTHASHLGRWESATARPHPALRRYVREYVGGVEDTHAPLCRRELPADIAPLIINFGAPFRLFDTSDPSRWTEVRSFMTGAFDTYALVGTTGAYACVQVNFTILGARLFLGHPLRELTNRVVALEDVLGSFATRLTSALFDAGSWPARFDLLDQVIVERLSAASMPRPVAWAVRQLVQHHGGLPIGGLADAVGWSHRHLVSQFTEQVGLGPKTLARVLRFGRAAEQLVDARGGHLADIAQDCGYYDQAHFTRDFRAFAGVTPTVLLASRLPHGAGFVA